MQFSIRRRCQMIDDLEGRTKTSLFLVAALQRDRQNTVIRRQQELRRPVCALLNAIGVDRRKSWVKSTENVQGSTPAVSCIG
jgi:hypothetical protein